jgi:hypothetical protein
MVTLRDLVECELAKREQADVNYVPFSVIVYDSPEALRDTATAVAAIEEHHKTGRERVRIIPDITEAVYAALEANHPRLFKKLGRCSVIARIIVGPGKRPETKPTAVEPDPPLPEEAAPSPVSNEDNVMQRAARRIALMRGLN